MITSKINILRKVFRENKDQVFLIDAKSGEEFTYKTLEDYSLKISGFLSSLGIKKGDRISFMLPNSIETSLLYFGCMQIGAIIVPINQLLKASEVSTVLLESKTKILFTTSYIKEELKDTKIPLPVPKILTISIKKTSDIKALKNIESVSDYDIWKEIDKQKSYKNISFKPIKDSDVLAIVYTSGTTSKPKGVEIRFGKIISNAITFTKAVGLPKGVRFLGTFSQGYLGGLYNALLFQFINYGSVVLESGFSTDVALRFWDIINKFKVSAIWPVPSIMNILLSIDRDKNSKKYAKRNLKFVFTGTSPLLPQTKEKFESQYGLKVFENYALSETLFISTSSSKLAQNKGAGKILSGCKVYILDDNEKMCKPFVAGEIVVKSKYMADRYYNNKKETAKNFRNNKLFTGDVGYFDQNGYLFVTDRKKDIIIRGGINISPKEIEEVILGITGILEVAVVGIPHTITGEEVIALVTSKKEINENEIKSKCSKILAPFKIPSRIIKVTEIPKSPTGKVQKNKARELVMKLIK